MDDLGGVGGMTAVWAVGGTGIVDNMNELDDMSGMALWCGVEVQPCNGGDG